MKAWQLTTVLAVLAIAAGQLPLREIADDAPPVRARLDTVVASSAHGFVGFEEGPPRDRVDDVVYRDRDIQACISEGRRDLGPLPDLMVTFHVTATGAVDGAQLTDPARLQGTSLDDCLSRGLEALQFAPVPKRTLTVHLPFKF